jgi:hypothetical protein
MKKLLTLLIGMTLSSLAFGQEYQTQLNDLIGCLLNFDNETYQDIEVKNDILRISMLNKKYITAKISDIDNTDIDLAKNTVVLKCKNGNCIYSSGTGSNQSTFNFSSSTGKDRNKLKDNFNKFLAAYRGEKVTKENSSGDYLDYFLYDMFIGTDEDEDNAKSTTTPTNDNQSPKTSTSSIHTATGTSSTSKAVGNQKYSVGLEKLNEYLKNFDNGYYGSLKIEGDFLIENFKSGDYCKAKLSSIDKAVEVTPNSKIVVKCKSGEECVYSTFTDSSHTQFSFSQSNEFKSSELIDLINNFLKAYNSK